jgi:enoyl-CoA hydratase/carnithine racemase
MTEDLVLATIDQETHVGTIRLNRPAKKNALSIALIGELIAAIDKMSRIEAVRCIVIEAAGDSFCAGRDLGDMRDRYREKVSFYDQGSTAIGIVNALRAAPQITIAKVQGYCVGGGYVLMAGCDLAVIAEDAKVGLPEILRGSYGRSATPMLMHAGIPKKHALMIQLTGRNLTGREAAAMGLASMAVPASDLESATASLASEIASRNPVALEHAKIAAYTESDVPFSMAVRIDEAMSHRMRFYTDPLSDVEGYLKSQKGGTNSAYKKPTD